MTRRKRGLKGAVGRSDRPVLSTLAAKFPFLQWFGGVKKYPAADPLRFSDEDPKLYK